MRPDLISRLVVALAVFLACPLAQARTLFEGFYKLEVKGVHAGYTVIRHSIDDRTGERVFAYYWLKSSGGTVAQWGVRTVSTTDFKPLRYGYWEAINGPLSHTTGSFTNGSLRISKYSGIDADATRMITSEDKPVPAGAIFSALISHLRAAVSDYREGQRASFVGLSEESSAFSRGDFNILRGGSAAGQQIFQVLCVFMNEPFEFFTLRNGEILGTRFGIQPQLTYLVATRDQAVADFGLNRDLLIKVFGDVPAGTVNPVSQGGGALDARAAINFPPLTHNDLGPPRK